MKLLRILLLLLFVGCSKTPQKDVFELARHGNVVEIEKLIKKNPAMLHKKNKSGFTPLILASYNGNKEVVSFLVKRGAKINELSDMGTALMAATYKGNNDIVKILINKDADVNITDFNNTSALHYACFFQNKELVRLFVKKQANITLKDNKGKTPLDYAIDYNNIEIIQILQTK